MTLWGLIPSPSCPPPGFLLGGKGVGNREAERRTMVIWEGKSFASKQLPPPKASGVQLIAE